MLEFANFRRSLIAIAALTCALGVPISTQLHAASQAESSTGLPSMGGGGELPLVQERKIGDSIARQLWRDPDLLDDPLLQAYVDGVFGALIAAARERGELDADMAERFAWRAFIGKDRTVNAFALPGGYFGVHAGLLKMTVTRDEFASVIAHEISHVTQRHISRNMTKQAQQQPLILAGTILGILASRNSPDALAATAMGSQAAGAQLQLNFSREMEREADRVGFNVLTHAGFAPEGMRSMFERLQNATRLVDSGSFPYLRSHPLTTERIAEVQSRVQLEPIGVMAPVSTVALGPRVGALANASSVLARDPAIGQAMHSLMSARAKVLADNSLDQLRVLTTEGLTATVDALPAERKVGALYTSMLAHHRLREFGDAWKRFEALKPLLVTDSIEFVAIEIAANELSRDQAISQGAGANWAAAQAFARPATSTHGQWRPTVMAWAATQINAGHAPQASERLQTWISEHPDDPYAWRLLSKAWEAQGRSLRSVEALAQAHKLEFDLSGALERLKAAQRMTRNTAADHVDASIIDAKAREIASVLREQNAQERVNRQFATGLKARTANVSFR